MFQLHAFLSTASLSNWTNATRLPPSIRPSVRLPWSDGRTSDGRRLIWVAGLPFLLPSSGIRFGLLRFLCANKVKCRDSRRIYCLRSRLHGICIRTLVYGVHVWCGSHPPANFVKHFCLKPLISYMFDLYVLPVTPCIHPGAPWKVNFIAKSGLSARCTAECLYSVARRVLGAPR